MPFNAFIKNYSEKFAYNYKIIVFKSDITDHIYGIT